MNRLPVIVLYAAFCAWVATAPAAERRPNILWIIPENVCLDFGCYGGKHVATPNIDKLASQGVRYTNAFSTAPVCSASRSAFITGMYQTTIEAHHARSHRGDGFPLPDGVRPITYLLRDAGYHTVNLKTIGERIVGTGKVDLNLDVGPKLWEASSDWSALLSDKPFFAQVNLPEVEFDIYDRRSAEKERVEWVGEKEHPQIAVPAKMTPPPYYPPHPIVKEEWARYLNSVSGLDRHVGAILDKLEADGLADDTIVLLFADNGRMEPRGIHWCYDEGLHVPLIIRFPKSFPSPQGWQAGGVDERIVSLIDVTATTLDLAGLPQPAKIQGRVFLGPHAAEPRKIAFSARDRIDESEHRIRTARTDRYRYLRNFRPDPVMSLNRYKEKCFRIVPQMRTLLAAGGLNPTQAALFAPLPPEELYDIVNDPHEITNLVGSSQPEHKQALAELRAAVERWIVETDDRGRFDEPRDVVAPFAKEMHDWFGTPAWYRKQLQP
jgi:arylsulfatase A-like enzyme